MSREPDQHQERPSTPPDPGTDGATPKKPKLVAHGGGEAAPEFVPDPPSLESETIDAARQPRVVRVPRKEGPRLHQDLVGKQQVQGTLPGDRYVRVIRQPKEDFARAAPGHLVATEEANEPRGAFGKAFRRIKRRVIGAPLTTASAAHERLSKVKALAVLSSDALSSVAYATEEILRVLVLAGLAALTVSLRSARPSSCCS